MAMIDGEVAENEKQVDIILELVDRADSDDSSK